MNPSIIKLFLVVTIAFSAYAIGHVDGEEAVVYGHHGNPACHLKP